MGHQGFVFKFLYILLYTNLIIHPYLHCAADIVDKQFNRTFFCKKFVFFDVLGNSCLGIA